MIGLRRPNGPIGGADVNGPIGPSARNRGQGSGLVGEGLAREPFADGVRGRRPAGQVELGQDVGDVALDRE
jgi:hypothetical protein